MSVGPYPVLSAIKIDTCVKHEAKDEGISQPSINTHHGLGPRDANLAYARASTFVICDLSKKSHNISGVNPSIGLAYSLKCEPAIRI